MDITVHFCGSTVKELRRAWQDAVQRGQGRLMRHITALLEVGTGGAVAQAAEQVGVSESTVYRWLQAFLLQRGDSLRYGSAPGRPSKLSPTQKARLKDLVAAGPLAAGYPTGCRFNPRCSEASDVCLAVSPEATPLPAAGLVRCHHHG